MKKILDIFISTRTMATLLFVYAFAMAYATFVENDFGTPTAKALIYEAKWFELVMLLLILNFIGNIARYRLLRREKWPTLVFHLAFIIIFIGGAITRYISYEGIMHIREGATSNEVITDKNFFKIQIEEKGDVLNYQDVPFTMIPDEARETKILAKIFASNFKAGYDFHGKQINVKQLRFIQRKKDSLIAGTSGTEYLHVVSTGNSGRENIYIKSGESKSINGTLVTFNRAIEGAVEFNNTKGEMLIKTPIDGNFMTMATQATGTTKKDEFQPLVLRSLYTINDLKLVVPEGLKKGKLIAYEGDRKKDKNVPDQLTVEVQGPKTTQIVDLPVEKGNPNAYKQLTIDGLNIILGFGPKVYNTPFSLKLEKFVMETYPGSSSPSAYESHVQVIDQGKQTPYRIYMNNVLNHGGYRFFQASFDPDRKGTVLSVNHDFWGTIISYIGYAFLFLGMFVSFFWKGSHFWKLNSNLKSINQKRAATVILLLLSFTFNAQNIDMHGTDGSPKQAHSENDGHNHGNSDAILMEDATPKKSQNTLALRSPKSITADEIIARNKISEEHAEKFGYLLVQNREGRIVPINTQALDILRKLYKSDRFKGTDGKSLSVNQWFLSINTDTASWTMVPMIKLLLGGDALKKKVKANEDGYTSLMNLFPADETGMLHYVLEEDYQTAFAKKPAEQSKYDLAVIDLNDRVQAFNEFFSGQFLRIVPVQNDSNSTWHSWLDQNFEPDEASQQVMGPYFSSILEAQQTGNWSKPDAELKKLSDYQQKWGKNVVPTETKVNLEVFMNKINLNFKLLIFYTLIGGLLLILGFIELFKPNRILNRIIKGIIAIGILGYIAHFLGLIARWFLSGHAPWSNGYEAIIFISWVGISAGLMFYFGFGKPNFKKISNPLKSINKKNVSNALIPASGFMVAVIMMGFAHGGSALDPQITPLAPVLKSYWLIIHVAIITSSYGFFALSMIISVITLVFYIISNKKSHQFHHDTTLKELTIVSEMSLTMGLLALVIGNFLGGIWANESWGRYWSWDPKETWAFISIMVYAFVLHMRLVPGLRGRWAFHVATMFAFCSMVMTYFGVNYYLSGLHSYAAGDPVPIPAWVYIGIGTMILLSVLSFFRFRQLTKK